MALNETTRNYFPGSSVDLMVEIVANHGGVFTFEMCWRDTWTQRETESCFEPLKFSAKSRNTDDTEDPNGLEYDLDPDAGTGIFTMSIELPANRTCDNCILRWHWTAANNWGTCEDGTEAVGCGYQEVYRNCADVSVKRIGSGVSSSRRRR